MYSQDGSHIQWDDTRLDSFLFRVQEGLTTPDGTKTARAGLERMGDDLALLSRDASFENNPHARASMQQHPLGPNVRWLVGSSPKTDPRPPPGELRSERQ